MTDTHRELPQSRIGLINITLDPIAGTSHRFSATLRPSFLRVYSC